MSDPVSTTPPSPAPAPVDPATEGRRRARLDRTARASCLVQSALEPGEEVMSTVIEGGSLTWELRTSGEQRAAKLGARISLALDDARVGTVAWFSADPMSAESDGSLWRVTVRVGIPTLQQEDPQW